MPSIIPSACALSALTVALHATGIAVLLRRLTNLYAMPPTDVWPSCEAAPHDLVADPAPSGGDFDLGLVLSVARMPAQCRSGVLLFRGDLHDLGYGDVVLAEPWRLLGPVEALMGVIMCGLSTGYFFVVVSRIHQWQPP